MLLAQSRDARVVNLSPGNSSGDQAAPATPASGLPARPRARAWAPQARRPPGRAHGARASAAGTWGSVTIPARNGGGRGSTKSPVPPRVLQFASRRRRETANPRDGRIRECSCRRRSTAATLIGHLAQLVPRRVAKTGLKPAALEARPAQPERRGGPGLGDDTAKPALHQRAQRDSFALGELASLTEKRIRSPDRSSS